MVQTKQCSLLVLSYMCYPNLTIPFAIFSSPLAAQGKLDYDAYFNHKIQKKVQDNTYRRFRVLTRSANQFPSAKHFIGSNAKLKEEGDVTVWCSNDYLGMSKHPKVIEAAM